MQTFNVSSRKDRTFIRSRYVDNTDYSQWKEIEADIHSREQHWRVSVVYQNPGMFDRVKCAWALWILDNSSYGHKLGGGKTGLSMDGTTGAMSSPPIARIGGGKC